MSLVKNAGALLFGLLPLLAGCAQPGPDAGDLDAPGLQPAGGNDTQNGYDPVTANDCWDDVLTALDLGLVDEGELNPALPASMLPGGACADALKYAYRCAGPVGSTLPAPASYAGGGLIDDADAWIKAGLDYALKQDVLECMIAHVNTSEMDICVSGADVNPGNCFTYQVPEAVWNVRLPHTGGVEFDVWLLAPDGLCATGAAASALEDRFCAGVDPGACLLNVKNNLAAACTENNGEYFCDGTPAITTRLSISDYFTLYPGCDPMPQ